MSINTSACPNASTIFPALEWTQNTQLGSSHGANCNDSAEVPMMATFLSGPRRCVRSGRPRPRAPTSRAAIDSYDAKEVATPDTHG